MDQANKMISRMRQYDQSKPIDLNSEMMRFVAYTSAKCFTGIDLSDDLYLKIIRFNKIINRIVVATNFLPKELLRLVFNRTVRKRRMAIISELIPVIQWYRNDKHLDESLIIRYAVDYVDCNGESLTNKQIGEIIVCLLYVSSENTALGLTASIMDLSNHPEYWNRIRDESRSYIENGDSKSLYASPLINACVVESARMNTHVFPLIRKPKDGNTVFAGYPVGDVDRIVMCEPVMMVYNNAKFKNATQYNPDRFIGEGRESMTPMSVMTWGAGLHLCPGRTFAIYEIKAAVALILNNFERFQFDQQEKNYFSPSAFVERNSTTYLKPLDEVLFNITE